MDLDDTMIPRGPWAVFRLARSASISPPTGGMVVTIRPVDGGPKYDATDLAAIAEFIAAAANSYLRLAIRLGVDPTDLASQDPLGRLFRAGERMAGADADDDLALRDEVNHLLGYAV